MNLWTKFAKREPILHHMQPIPLPSLSHARRRLARLKCRRKPVYWQSRNGRRDGRGRGFTVAKSALKGRQMERKTAVLPLVFFITPLPHVTSPLNEDVVPIPQSTPWKPWKTFNSVLSDYLAGLLLPNCSIVKHQAWNPRNTLSSFNLFMKFKWSKKLKGDRSLNM